MAEEKEGFYSRLSDCGPVQDLPPIVDWQRAQSVSVHEAVSCLSLSNTEHYCQSALDIANEYLCNHQESPLSPDEAAAINLYTQHNFLYGPLNKLLRDKDRGKLVPWSPYLKLFLGGLDKMRRASFDSTVSDGTTVSRLMHTFRGIPEALGSTYKEGKEFIDWAAVSTTTSKVVGMERFLRKGEATVFYIEGSCGVDISELSVFKDETEVLYAPGTCFKVEEKVEVATHIIRLRELLSLQTQHELFQRGQCLANENDLALAVVFYRLAAEQGHAAAQCQLGACYFNGIGVAKDEREGAEFFSLAAGQGHADAENKLGVSYQMGRGVEKNSQEAARLYRLAADRGFAKAQYNLGLCYANGTGVEKDEQEAISLYQLAANQDHAGAQFNLGLCYANGTGVLEDKEKAVTLYGLAANQGHTVAQNNLGLCYRQGTGVAKDEHEAFRLYGLAAEKGYAFAQFNLGLCYANGTGVEKNEQEAVRLYHLAANQGSAFAQNNLGICYANGTGVVEDKQKAVRLYQLAADQGHAAAQCNLGRCYERGTKVVKSEQEAVKLYQRAADQGDAVAQFNLGICCEFGKGMKKNRKKAMNYYQLASEQGDLDAAAKLVTFKHSC